MRRSDKSEKSSPGGASWRSSRDLDSTFSFILRIRIDHSDGSGVWRPLFKLEDISAGKEWRFTDYESAAQCLTTRVQEIIHPPDPR